MTRIAALSALALALLGAGPSTGPSADTLKGSMQGSWTAVAVSGAPQSQRGATPAGLTLVVDGDHLTLTDRGRDERAGLAVDAAHSPAWFELKSDAGRQLVAGIVDVTADGHLRMAFRKQGQGDRPTTFDPADGVTVLTFHRTPATQPAATRP